MKANCMVWHFPVLCFPCYFYCLVSGAHYMNIEAHYMNIEAHYMNIEAHYMNIEAPCLKLPLCFFFYFHFKYIFLSLSSLFNIIDMENLHPHKMREKKHYMMMLLY